MQAVERIGPQPVEGAEGVAESQSPFAGAPADPPPADPPPVPSPKKPKR